MKKYAVLSMCLGELWWEFGNFAPHIIWKRAVQYKDRDDIDFVVMTRPDRFDIYGLYADIFVPLRIEGDGTIYRANGFRLDGLGEDKYNLLACYFKEQYVGRYIDVDLIYPSISGKRQHVNRHQFSLNQMLFSYQPRKENKKIVDSYFPGDKKIVTLAPRFRSGFKRNWPFWQEFYDILFEDKDLLNSYTFVICGKSPDYVPDKYDRFSDLNKVKLGEFSSLIGITIETIRKSVLTVGSQSGIPNISLMLGTPVLEWGHEKQYHTIDYNLKKTSVKFIEDYRYDIPPRKIFNEMKKILEFGF